MVLPRLSGGIHSDGSGDAGDSECAAVLQGIFVPCRSGQPDVGVAAEASGGESIPIFGRGDGYCREVLLLTAFWICDV